MFKPGLPLTISSAQPALDEGLRAIERGEGSFDLSGATTADSVTIALLLAWRRAAMARGVDLQFSNPSASIVVLAGLYGVDGLLQL